MNLDYVHEIILIILYVCNLVKFFFSYLFMCMIIRPLVISPSPQKKVSWLPRRPRYPLSKTLVRLIMYKTRNKKVRGSNVIIATSLFLNKAF
jgi:hypothetical protein